MLRTFAALVLVALIQLLAGCASTYPEKPSPFADYSFRHSRYDFTVAWNAAPAPGGVAVDVLLRNVRYMAVNDLTLEISLLRGEKVVAKGSEFMTQDLKDDEYARLQVILRNANTAPGDKLHFQIRYTGIEGDGAMNKVISDFTANASTGAILRVPGEAP